MSKMIELTQGYRAIVDADDYDELAKYKWHYAHGYAVRTASPKEIRMHRVVINAPEGKEVDHINRNRLDNRKTNLRLATRSQNQANRALLRNNTSGYKGVNYIRATGKWAARIKVNGRVTHLGTFINKEDAYEAFKKKALAIHKEYACV